MRTIARLAAVVVLAAVSACGGGGGRSPVGTGAGGAGGADASVGAGAGGAGGGGGECGAAPALEAPAPDCNTVVNGADAVPFTAGAGTPAAPSGGSIRDGVYHATRAEGYGAAPQNGRRLTIVILDGGTRWLWAGDVLDAAGAQSQLSFRADAAVAIAGTTLAFTTACSSSATSPLPASLAFTATGDQLVLALAMPTYTAVTTYTRSGCE